MKKFLILSFILIGTAVGSVANAKDAKIRQILLSNKKVSLDQISTTEIKVGQELIPIQEKNCVLKVTAIENKKIFADASQCNDFEKLKKNDVFELSDFVNDNKTEEAAEAKDIPEASITETKKTTGFQVLGGLSGGGYFSIDYTNGYDVHLLTDPSLQVGIRYQYFKGSFGFNLGYFYDTIRNADEVDVDGYPDSVFTETKYGHIGLSFVEANLLINFRRFYGNIGLHKTIVYKDDDWGKVEGGTGAQIGLGAYFYERFFGEAQLSYSVFDWTPTPGTTYDMFYANLNVRVGYTF